MIALVVTAATLLLVGAVVVSLERHRRLTPITALITGLATLAIVLGAITTTIVAADPAFATGPTRGLVNQPLIERVVDFELPLPEPLD